MELKPVATGYCFLEAPRVDGDALWFSDLLLGGIYRRTADGKVESFLTEYKNIGGIALNDDGALIVSGKHGIAWFDPKTKKFVMLLDSVDGKALTGVNDMIPDGKGGLYFGTLSKGGDYSGTPSKTALYRFAPDGKVTLQNDAVSFANGVGLSPDGKRLYHNESLVGTFMYDVLPDGNLTNHRMFSDRKDGDGLAVDAEGGVWVAGYDSAEIARYTPEGKLDRRAALPHKFVSSLCFGGPDWRDVYVTTAGNDGLDGLFKGILPPKEAAVFHGRSDIAGVPVAKTRFRPR